jgi:hypothetical protein
MQSAERKMQNFLLPSAFCILHSAFLSAKSQLPIIAGLVSAEELAQWCFLRR